KRCQYVAGGRHLEVRHNEFLLYPLVANWSGSRIDEVVHNAVVLRLLSSKPAVAVGVLVNLQKWLTSVLIEKLSPYSRGSCELFSLNGGIRCGTAYTSGRLVHHDACVWQGETLALGAARKQELAHRRSKTHAISANITWRVLHGVV